MRISKSVNASLSPHYVPQLVAANYFYNFKIDKSCIYIGVGIVFSKFR